MTTGHPDGRRAASPSAGGPEPSPGTLFKLTLTSNGAPPLAESVAALERLVLVFAITDPKVTPEHMAAWLVMSLKLDGRVNILLEPWRGEW